MSIESMDICLDWNRIREIRRLAFVHVRGVCVPSIFPCSTTDRHGLVVTIWFDPIFVQSLTPPAGCRRRRQAAGLAGQSAGQSAGHRPATALLGFALKNKPQDMQDSLQDSLQDTVLQASCKDLLLKTSRRTACRTVCRTPSCDRPARIRS